MPRRRLRRQGEDQTGSIAEAARVGRRRRADIRAAIFVMARHIGAIGRAVKTNVGSVRRWLD
jgi:hypothetical protein